MAKRIKRNKKPGLPPGSVVFTGNRKVEKILLHFLQYDATFIEEKELDNHSNIPFQVSTDEKVNWYDIRGIHDTQLIELIGQSFDIHPLSLKILPIRIKDPSSMNTSPGYLSSSRPWLLTRKPAR